MTDYIGNMPISEQWRYAKLDAIDKKAAADMLEGSKPHVMAKKEAEYGDIAVNKAERLVRATDFYKTYITNMIEARKAHGIAETEAEYLRMKFWEGQSTSASQRAEMRMLGDTP